MSAPEEKLVFISHASSDAKKAAALCKALEDKGFGCWIAPRDIGAGAQYGEEIIRGIQDTRGLVLMLSAKSNASPHVRDEAERAKHYGKRVIPFRIEDVTPSQSLEFYIATSQWIDAFGAQWNTGVSELSAAIEKLVGQPPTKVPTTAPPAAARVKRLPIWIAAACLVAATAGISGWMLTHRDSPVAPAEPGAPDTRDSAMQQPATQDTIHLPAPSAWVRPNDSELVPRYHALVVGINTYADYGDMGWEPLRTAANDAREIAGTLNTQYGFDVKLLINEAATRANIMQELDTIATAYPGDAILIYYAGHGFYVDDVDQGYWIPADARRKTPEGRPAKQDWVWNSTIQEMMSSTKSKHVLMIADSCFSGALFRGAEADEWFARETPWYRRAIKNNSRYLITSGGLEPVPDGGGGGHSVFARKILDFLRDNKGVFSASDMGQSVRQEVNAQTGQRVRMGHLPVKSHEGGEFVFLHNEQDLPAEPESTEVNDAPVIEVAMIQSQIQPRAPSESKLVAAEMFAAGATNAALEVLESLDDDPHAQALADELQLRVNQQREDGIQKLIAGLEKRVIEEKNGEVSLDDLWGEEPDADPSDLRKAESNMEEILGLTPIDTAPTSAPDKASSELFDEHVNEDARDSSSAQALDAAQQELDAAARASDNSLSDAQDTIDAAHEVGAAIRNAAAKEANRQDAQNSLGGQLTSAIEEAARTSQESVGTAVGTAVGERTARKMRKEEEEKQAQPASAPPIVPAPKEDSNP